MFIIVHIFILGFIGHLTESIIPPRTNPEDWIPPISIWSKLKFQVIPEERYSSGSPIVPEPFDAKKLNASVSKDGFLIGQKFCQCGRSPWRQTSRPEDAFFKNDIPWTSTLILKNHKNVFCGGALVNDRVVVTAAHCVNRMRANQLSVHISEDEVLPSSSTIFQTLRFNVDEIRIHDNYNPKTIEHDVALLILSEPIDFFQIPLSPACLPVQSDEYTKYKATVTEWVSVLDSRGKNSSDHLHKAILDLITTAECERLEEYSGLISENHICTKSCQGDHGGQLIVEKNDRKLLVGIGSWGFNCRGEKIPSVYTKIPKYASWILKNSRDAEWCVE